MRGLSIIGISLLMGASVLSSGCASISEDDCLAGNWGERGFKDGNAGVSRSRLADYVKRCSEFATNVDEVTYVTEYERGLDRYCVFETGFDRGQSGSSYNAVCSGRFATGYAEGYDEGKAVYVIFQEHGNMVDRYNDTLDDVVEVRRKLREDEFDADERRRLQKKLLRLQDRRETLREDIREYEREFNIPRHDFD